MSHVEITLKSGTTITADVSEWATRKSRATEQVIGYEWVDDGPRRLMSLDFSEVAAVVFVDDSEETQS